MRLCVLTGVVVLAATVTMARAQEMPKPGPEHEKFKELVGEWDAVVNFGGGETKGKSVWKIDFNGFFLVQEFESEFGGMKFKGRGQSGYCPIRKQYVSSWIDSMSPSPMTMYGNYDKSGKVFTETGEGANMEGKMAKIKSVSKMPDKDTLVFTMYEVKDGKDVQTMSITYKRKK